MPAPFEINAEQIYAVAGDEEVVLVVTTKGEVDVHEWGQIASLGANFTPIPHAGALLDPDEYVNSEIVTPDRVVHLLNEHNGDADAAAEALGRTVRQTIEGRERTTTTS